MSAVVEAHTLELRAGPVEFWTVECWDCGLTVMADGRAVYTHLIDAASACDLHNAKRHTLTARLVRGKYADGGLPYWLVECDKCSTSFNSGIRFRSRDLEDAQRLADEHNAQVHGLTEPPEVTA